MRRRWLLVLALPVTFVPVAGSADAATCKVMTVGYAFASGSVIAVQPDHQDIAYGGCVQFTNNLDLDATITVSGGYSVTLGPKESTTSKQAYVGRSPGRHGLTARSGPSSAAGSITVGPAPQPSPSPTRAPTPDRTKARPHSHSPRPASSSSSSSGPRVAPVPPRVGGSIPKSRAPSPPPAPSVAPTPFTTTPAPRPSATPAPAVISFPIEPPSGRGAGLPGAVAALAVVGTAAGLVRVLLAEPVGPVDGRRRSVGGAS